MSSKKIAANLPLENNLKVKSISTGQMSSRKEPSGLRGDDDVSLVYFQPDQQIKSR